MGLTPLAFTGISKFSQDFQTIINRSASIAALSVRKLENDQVEITNKKIALTDMSVAVGNLAAALSALRDKADHKALIATTSNPSLASATIGPESSPGSYILSDINSLARVASSVSGSFPDQDTTEIVPGGSLELVVGSTVHLITLTPETNNLNGLRDAINAKSAGVAATIIETGDGTTPEYRLLISANATGENAIELRTGGVNILPTVDAGANAEFKLNGQSIIRSSNRISDVIPGVSITLTGTTSGSEAVTLNVKSDHNALASVLYGLVQTYNGVVGKLDQHTGKAGGALTGDASVRQVRGALQTMLASGSSAISLRDVGITIGDDGRLSFDADHLDALSAGELEKAFTLLGSGGLGASVAALEALSNPVSGLFETQQEDYDTTLESLSDRIAILNERAATMQLTLRAKLQAADVLLAQLEQQQSLLLSSIESLNFALYGKQQG